MTGEMRDLSQLAPDLLGIIAAHVSNPLHPKDAVSLSRTCHAFRHASHNTLERLLGLRPTIKAARILCLQKASFLQEGTTTDRQLSTAAHRTEMVCIPFVPGVQHNPINALDLAAMGMLMSEGLLGKLTFLQLGRLPDVHDTWYKGMFDPMQNKLRLKILDLWDCGFGVEAATSFRADIDRGALRDLQTVSIKSNRRLGDGGVQTLAKSFRALTCLWRLVLHDCNISDEGVNKLVVANQGDADFKKLLFLELTANKLTDTTLFELAFAIKAGGLPSIMGLDAKCPNQSIPAQSKLQAAIDARR